MLRICPGFSLGKINPTLNSSSKDSPYGFLPEEGDLWETLASITNCKKLKFVGFHLHLGSGIKSRKPYRKAFSILERIIIESMKYGLKTRMIDIGGGFGTASSPILSLAQLAKQTLYNKHTSIPSYQKSSLIEHVAADLRRLLDRLHRSGIKIEEVLVEPGRVISGPSQIIILSVLDSIERSRGKRFLICDGGAMSLSPLLLTAYHKIIPTHFHNEKKKMVDYTILGNLPTALDKLSSSTLLPLVNPGDRLALLDVGAYFVPMNNNFAGPRPAIFLLDGNNSRLIRRRESLEDVYRRDFIFSKIMKRERTVVNRNKRALGSFTSFLFDMHKIESVEGKSEREVGNMENRIII
jgi:diaminopimelate decarboxylase